MKLSQAKLCLDCDEVYQASLSACPTCDHCQFVYLKPWLDRQPTELVQNLNKVSIKRKEKTK